jgi:hypothetical protein
MPSRDKYCTYSPHLECTEVFGSQKFKLAIRIGVDDGIHRPDTVKFSLPCVAKRTMRSHVTPLPTIVEDFFPSVIKVASTSHIGLDFRRVTIVHEFKVDKKL